MRRHGPSAGFIVSLVAGQAIAISLGLLVERHYSSYAGLVTFIALYFTMFWLAWKFAVRSPNPAHGWAAGWAVTPSNSTRPNVTDRGPTQDR